MKWNYETIKQMPGYHEVFGRLHYKDSTKATLCRYWNPKDILHSGNQPWHISVSSLTHTKCVSLVRAGASEDFRYRMSVVSYCSPMTDCRPQVQRELQDFHEANTSKRVSSFKHSPYSLERSWQDSFLTLQIAPNVLPPATHTQLRRALTVPGMKTC
jgi:hypothetical protein